MTLRIKYLKKEKKRKKKKKKEKKISCLTVVFSKGQLSASPGYSKKMLNF